MMTAETAFRAENPVPWDEIDPDLVVVTETREITSGDVAAFCAATAFEGRLFSDPEYARSSGYSRQPVPGAFVLAVADGLILRTGFYTGSGVAFLGADLSVVGATHVGDRIHATMRNLSIRQTSSKGRAVVHDRVTVVDQDARELLIYDVKRLVRGRAELDRMTADATRKKGH